MANLVWDSFNDGELSPLLDGRVDMPQYMKGGEISLNMIPTIQGATTRRGGSRLIGDTAYGNVPSLLIRFSRSQTESYILEFYAGGIRFYNNGALVVTMAPPYPAYSIASPYTQSDLFNTDGTPAIVAVESADVIYLTHPKHPPQVLSFYGPTNWVMTQFQSVDGPWEDGNANLSNLIYFAGGPTIGSTGTLISNTAGTFQAGHVGSLFRLHQQDLTNLKPWAPGEQTPNIAIGVQRRAGFLTIQCTNASHGIPPPGGTSLMFVQCGAVTPTQTTGKMWDGDQTTTIDPIGANTYYSTGVQWSYQDCGYGVLRITGYIDSQHVVGVVLRQLPASLSTQPSNNWEMGAWNQVNGYPSCVTIFLQRLTFAGGTWVWGSVVGDFTNFADMSFGEVTDDSAFSVRCLSSQVNSIVYMSPAQTLLVGTIGGEFIIGPQSISDPFGPSNLGVTLQSEYGGRAVVPIRVQQFTLFITKNGRTMRESSFAFSAGPNGAYVSNDLTVLSEHITKSGIISMAWAKNPHTTIYCVLADGNLVSFTYNPEQSVKCWARHSVVGKVSSIAVVPNSTGEWDDVYIVVDRSIDYFGTIIPIYTIERIEQPFLNLPGDSQQECFYVDCGSTLDNTISASLGLGNGDYSVAGTQNISLFTNNPVFQATDVGRYIHYDWESTQIGADGLVVPLAVKGIALITDYYNPTFVNGTIIAPFPQLSGADIPANEWRMTVTQITNPPTMWQGQTLSILADGACQPDVAYPLTGGDIALQYPASYIQCGIKSPSVYRTMKPEGGDPTGSSMGKEKREVRFTIRYVNSLGFSYGPNFEELIIYDERDPTIPNNEPAPVSTGETPRLTWNGNWDNYGRIMVAQTQPLPFTLAAIAAEIDIGVDG